ncbi:unnamed protein product [Soboliphyme baturini]|uniref:MARVEL domain-containing protein n=1 Tax=Soboliphyme baturini TaxID=241478 RepID=A0A183IJ96_9BILA|nr:unnamed protein product [Soboliphyme baturini]
MRIRSSAAMKILCLRVISLFALMVMIFSTLEICIFLYISTLHSGLVKHYTSLWAGLSSVALAAAIVYLHIAYCRLSSFHGFTLFGLITSLQCVAWLLSEFVEWRTVDECSTVVPSPSLFRIHWYSSILFSLSVACSFGGFEFALLVYLIWLPKYLTIPRMFAVSPHDERPPPRSPQHDAANLSSEIKSLNFSGHLASTPKDRLHEGHKRCATAMTATVDSPYFEPFYCTPFMKGKVVIKNHNTPKSNELSAVKQQTAIKSARQQAAIENSLIEHPDLPLRSYGMVIRPNFRKNRRPIVSKF